MNEGTATGNLDLEVWNLMLAWLAAALGGIAVAVLLYHMALTVAYPFDLDYGEGYVLFDAVRLAGGAPIYTDIQQFPMVRSPYPPLAPWLWSLAVPLAGPRFWPGRLMAAAALGATAGLLLWSARRLPGVGRGAWLAPLALLASPLVYQWAGYARVDTLALLFSVGAVTSAQWLPGRRGIVAAALLSTLALWTKQTAIAAPVAIAVALLARSPRQAAAFAAAVVVPTAAMAALLDARTAGEFTRHVIQGNSQNPYYLVRAVQMYGTFLLLHLALLGATTAWAARHLRGIPSPIALYLPVSLLAALSVGNGGSSVNYFLEPLAAAGLALPFAWRSLARPRPTLALAVAAIQLVFLFHWPNGFGTDYLSVPPHGRTPTRADLEAAERVDAAVQAESGPVLTEAAGFAVSNGRPVLVQPIDLRAEALLGRWNSEPLLAALRSGQVKLVVQVYGLLPFDVERELADRWFVERDLAGDNGLRFRLLRPVG